MPLCKQIKRKAQLTASLLVKLTPRNVNLGNGRFAMFNKERDILMGLNMADDVTDPAKAQTNHCDRKPADARSGAGRQREQHVKRKTNESPRSSNKKLHRPSDDNLIQDNYRHSWHNRSRWRRR